MSGIISLPSSFSALKHVNNNNNRMTVKMSARSVKLPSHPTYDLSAVIRLALTEDAGDRGDVTCKATIPVETEVEAHFLAKEDGIVAGIALAEMVFNEVDPSLKVEWYSKDGDNVHKGLQFGKVHGRAHSIVVAERVALNFMQRMSGIATLTKDASEQSLQLPDGYNIGNEFLETIRQTSLISRILIVSDGRKSGQ